MPPLPIDIPIVILASACWETPSPVNVHHIARRFAARGHRVLFMESTGIRPPSIGSAHDVSRIRRRLSQRRRGIVQVEPNLFVLSPLALPWRRPLRTLGMKWIARAVRGACRSLSFEKPIMWAFLPTYLRAIDTGYLATAGLLNKSILARCDPPYRDANEDSSRVRPTFFNSPTATYYSSFSSSHASSQRVTLNE